MRSKKAIPRFKNEADEAIFWSRHDSTEFVDYRRARKGMFPNLEPSVRTISIRLPESLLQSLKMLARKRDVPYQSLVKMFLAEKVAGALRRA